MKASFENCIRCTICVENCPVFKANPEYPGPKQAGPDAEDSALMVLKLWTNGLLTVPSANVVIFPAPMA